jgi:hypothetical protein
MSRIKKLRRWLRRRYWAIEDALTDLIDWQPSPAPTLKPLPPAPPKEQHKVVPFCFTGLSFNRATAESTDAERLREVFRAIGRNTYVEIKW